MTTEGADHRYLRYLIASMRPFERDEIRQLFNEFILYISRGEYRVPDRRKVDSLLFSMRDSFCLQVQCRDGDATVVPFSLVRCFELISFV